MLVHKPPGQVELQVFSEYYAGFCTEISCYIGEFPPQSSRGREPGIITKRSLYDSDISSHRGPFIIIQLYLITFRLTLPYCVMMHADLLMSEMLVNERSKAPHPFRLEEKPN